MFISANLYVLWKPQDLWEEEDVLKKNPVVTGPWLLRWYGNCGVWLSLLLQEPWAAECFLRNTSVSSTLA